MKFEVCKKCLFLGYVLFIDNTMLHGLMGLWRAWKLDEDGKKIQCGTVPSKSR